MSETEEQVRKELAAAEEALASIGKKGLLERQSTHDKKVAEAQAAVDAAKAKLAAITGQPAETKADAPAAASSSDSSVEAAAERIRKLKAENAPQVTFFFPPRKRRLGRIESD